MFAMLLQIFRTPTSITPKLGLLVEILNDLLMGVTSQNQRLYFSNIHAVLKPRKTCDTRFIPAIIRAKSGPTVRPEPCALYRN